MLRSLVVLILGVNVVLFFWIRANPTWGEAEREPQRLQRQVAPSSIQVLPDLPASAASVPLAAAAGGELSFAPPAAGLPAVPPASAPAADAVVPHAASAPVRTSAVSPRRPGAGRSGSAR